jgi:HAD superfamily hydrolase (TIGR01509 family)
MPGAVRVLEALKEADVDRVLVTGSQQDTILERIDKDFANLFGEVKVTGHDVRKGKPNPEPYLKAMAKAEKKPNQCIVIENAPLGVQAAHAAGCFTIGVTTGPIPEKDLYKAGADLVYKNMDELAAALPSLLVALSLVKA